jgi:hypothetical protein
MAIDATFQICSMLLLLSLTHYVFSFCSLCFLNQWFKPAELVTKHGLQGNIIDSVGDHGTMKCLFNAPIKQHDTVCINLYKRIYPKYAPVKVMSETGEKEEERILIL